MKRFLLAFMLIATRAWAPCYEDCAPNCPDADEVQMAGRAYININTNDIWWAPSFFACPNAINETACNRPCPDAWYSDGSTLCDSLSMGKWYWIYLPIRNQAEYDSIGWECPEGTYTDVGYVYRGFNKEGMITCTGGVNAAWIETIDTGTADPSTPGLNSRRLKTIADYFDANDSTLAAPGPFHMGRITGWHRSFPMDYNGCNTQAGNQCGWLEVRHFATTSNRTHYTMKWDLELTEIGNDYRHRTWAVD